MKIVYTYTYILFCNLNHRQLLCFLPVLPKIIKKFLLFISSTINIKEYKITINLDMKAVAYLYS